MPIRKEKVLGYLLRLLQTLKRIFHIGGGAIPTMQLAFLIAKSQGLAGIVRAVKYAIKTSNHFELANSPESFSPWFRKNYINNIRPLNHRGPKISIILPVFDPPLNFLIAAVESVLAQNFSNWELCVVDDCCKSPEVKHYLERLPERDARIRLTQNKTNLHISASTNKGVLLSTGDYVCFLDHDDILFPWSLDFVAAEIYCNPGVKYMYSDEVMIDEAGEFLSGHFKPDLNVTLLENYNYFCHLSVYKRDFLLEIEMFTIGLEGAQDYDLSLRAIDSVDSKFIRHIDTPLYGWRVFPGSTASGSEAKPYAAEAGRKALVSHFQRIGKSVEVGFHERVQGAYEIRRSLISSPKISILIPTRDQLDLLRKCLITILEKSSYRNFEIVIIDNGTTDPEALRFLDECAVENVRVIRLDVPFNYSLLNNRAAEVATGEFLVLLNNDIEIVSPTWIEEMLVFAQESSVGAVGAKLLYPDGSIQHGGVIVGIGDVAGHAHRHFPESSVGYMGRLDLPQELSAVTGACLMVSKSKFLEVGGLTEELTVGYNDVDFCLKLTSKGYRNVYSPSATLIHHESKSRGFDDSPLKKARASLESKYMQERWQSILKRDPHYNRNLSLMTEDFSLASIPRNAEEIN